MHILFHLKKLITINAPSSFWSYPLTIVLFLFQIYLILFINGTDKKFLKFQNFVKISRFIKNLNFNPNSNFS
jgi:hypothetical protein